MCQCEDCTIDLHHPYEWLQINSQGQAFGNALDFGAGHINPEAALNPGLGRWPENHPQLHRLIILFVKAYGCI